MYKQNLRKEDWGKIAQKENGNSFYKLVKSLYINIYKLKWNSLYLSLCVCVCVCVCVWLSQCVDQTSFQSLIGFGTGVIACDRIMLSHFVVLLFLWPLNLLLTYIFMKVLDVYQLIYFLALGLVWNVIGYVIEMKNYGDKIHMLLLLIPSYHWVLVRFLAVLMIDSLF